MSIKEQHGIKGRLTIIMRDKEGKVVEKLKVDNIITNAGKELIANYFTGAIQAVPELYIAVGSDGDTKADPTNIALGAFLEEAEANTDVVGGAATVTATLPAKGEDENRELREAGIRIHVHGKEPVLYNRVTFPLVNKSGNMEMTLTWEVIF